MALRILFLDLYGGFNNNSLSGIHSFYTVLPINVIFHNKMFLKEQKIKHFPNNTFA